jgi:cephalosporin hydroxylase
MMMSTDPAAGLLRIGDRAYPLYSEEAFRLFSQEWMRLAWNRRYWMRHSWAGRQILQLPDDILRLAAAVWRVRPDVIVETGVYDGGSTLLFADLCTLLGRGRVIAVEKHLRSEVKLALSGRSEITLVEGDSAAEETGRRVRDLTESAETVFVFLDSDHSAGHVRAELRLYGPLVTAGSYLVVADTNMPELADTPEGSLLWRTDHPRIAVQEFLETRSDFACEHPGGLTYFPGGWLRRLSSSAAAPSPQADARGAVAAFEPPRGFDITPGTVPEAGHCTDSPDQRAWTREHELAECRTRLVSAELQIARQEELIMQLRAGLEEAQRLALERLEENELNERRLAEFRDALERAETIAGERLEQLRLYDEALAHAQRIVAEQNEELAGLRLTTVSAQDHSE